MAKKSTKQKKSLTSLHALLDSITFSGTIARTLLVALLLFFIFIVVSVILGASNVSSSDNTETAGLLLLHFIGAGVVFLVFDSLYVWVREIHQLPILLDRAILFIAELGAVAVFLALFLLVTSLTVAGVSLWVPLALLAVLILRYLIGVAFSRN